METEISEPVCKGMLTNIGDALYVIGGKWSLRVIVALKEGNKRFNDIQRTIDGISARVLSNELKELELNGFVNRVVHTTPTVMVEYEITDYAGSLEEVLLALANWGSFHRDKLRKERRA